MNSAERTAASNQPAGAAHTDAAPDTVLDLMRLHADATTHEAVRRRGVLMMYSPLFFVALLLGVMASSIGFYSPNGRGNGVRGPAWVQYLMGSLGIGLMLSLPVAAAGVGVRLTGALQLRGLARRVPVEHLPPLPEPIAGEQLGTWRVEESTPERLTLRRRMAPPVLWKPIVWSVSSFLLFIAATTVRMGIRSGNWGGTVISMTLVLLWIVGIGRMFVDMRVFFERLGPVGTMRVRYAWHPLLPKRWTTFESTSGLEIAVARDRLAIGDQRRNIVLRNFTPGPIGSWQARRVAAAAARILDLQEAS